MSDVIDTTLSLSPAADATWPGNMERRRPGRRNDVSPELIALMRKPSDQVRRAVALYDAPNFVLPAAPASRAAMSSMQIARLLTAGAGCALLWAVAIRGMMMAWG